MKGIFFLFLVRLTIYSEPYSEFKVLNEVYLTKPRVYLTKFHLVH